MKHNEWQVVCEKCGWEGLAKELVSNNLEDNCPQCHSNRIEWKGEPEDDFAALYKELAILEKQSKERYQKMIKDLEAAIKVGRDSINEMAKQISQQNDLIVSLEAAVDQKTLAIDHFKTKIAQALSFIHEHKEGNAIQILNHLL
jgi:chromosome segregation ATPase